MTPEFRLSVSGQPSCASRTSAASTRAAVTIGFISIVARHSGTFAPAGDQLDHERRRLGGRLSAALPSLTTSVTRWLRQKKSCEVRWPAGCAARSFDSHTMRLRALSTGAAKLKHYKLSAVAIGQQRLVAGGGPHAAHRPAARDGGADTAAQPDPPAARAGGLRARDGDVRRAQDAAENWRHPLRARGAPGRARRATCRSDAEPPVPARLLEVRGRAYVDTAEPQSKIDELAARVHVRCPVASMIVASGAVLDVDFVAEPGGSPPSDGMRADERGRRLMEVNFERF